MSAGERVPGRGRLFVVATPIGNLADITYRAVAVLGEVSIVAAEDTRRSGKLLAHYRITTPLVRYHEHNARRQVDVLLEKLQGGSDVALISDAGTPGIADPGYRLVRACHAAGIIVVAVPGPSALVAALSIAGVPTDRFTFEGFLPAKAKARQKRLQEKALADNTLVFYETPHRLVAALQDLAAACGPDRLLVVARELTKLHEEIFRGSVAEAAEHFATEKVKGELVLVLPAGEQEHNVSMTVALQTMLAESDLPRRDIVKMIAREYGISGSEVYRESLKYPGWCE